MKKPEEYNKLINEINAFISIIPGNTKLDIHQRQTISTDCLMKILEKEAQGRLKLESYPDYKGYLFLTVRNAVYRIYKYEKSIKGSQEEVFIQDLNMPEYSINQKSTFELKEIIDGLPPQDRAIIRWICVRNWFQRDIAFALGCSRTLVNQRFQRIKGEIQLALVS